MILSRCFLFVILSLQSYVQIPELKVVSATNPSPPSTPASQPASGHEPGPAPGSHSPLPTPSPEQSNEDYYTFTVTASEVDKILPQDNADAKTIKDVLENNPDNKDEIIANILGRRDPARRIVINKALNRDGHPLINATYVPQGPDESRFMDVCFGLVNEEPIVTAIYIGNAFENKDTTTITIGMILTKDIKRMIETYNGQYEDTFEKCRGKQKSPFKNMLRVWAANNREQDDKSPVNADKVKGDADILLKEQAKWNDVNNNKRDQLELILMVKSIKYARAVIAEFEKQRGNALIEEIINDTLTRHKALAETYSSLAIYIKDRHKYIAGLLAKYNDNSDLYSAWIMVLGTVRPQEWPKINAAFKANNGQNLSKFIGDCADLRYTTFHEMMAMVVDPAYKPEEISINLPSHHDPASGQQHQKQH